MEERTGWRSAFGTAWGNLTGINDEGNTRIIRILFFLFFLFGTAWTAWRYKQGLRLTGIDEISASSVPNQAQADKKRLDAMIRQVELTSLLRAGSLDAVRLIEENTAKYPFREPGAVDDIYLTEEDASLVSPPVVVVDYPPEITLRGIMIMGKQNIAVLDISGVGTGIIVKAGDTFMQRQGRIARIAPDKVVVSWGGKNWDIVPSF